MSFWLQVGGIVLGALSLFKLVQRYAEFGLSSIFTDVISFYQQFFYPITQIVNLAAAFVFSLVGLHIPRVPDDIIVLYFLLGGSFARALILPRPQYPFRFDIMLAVIQVPLWPLWFILHASDTYEFDKKFITLDDIRVWSVQFLATIAAFFALFALNAYGVSVGS